jgi:predicted nuclease of restriction endonuclease-like (RecB) superfamily
MRFSQLATTIQNTHNALQQSAVKAINSHITIRNWMIGWYIFEYEQKGEDRARYGKKLLEKLALKIKIKGLSSSELSRCRQFYLCYPGFMKFLNESSTINESLRMRSLFPVSEKSARSSNSTRKILPKTPPDSRIQIFGTLSQKSGDSGYYQTLVNTIPFSHFTELIKINDPLKRKYYELLIIKQTLSFRELKRQINSLCFERLGLSSNRRKAFTQIRRSIKPQKPTEIVKDFYLFEFLELTNKEQIQESDLESALLDHLEKFMLELGNGFCFEARQKRVLVGDEYHFIDIVFYHRILQCHILVELKVGSFEQSHISQLDTFLNYYNKEIRTRTDNPPIGILMVTDKNNALVEYATAGIDKRLFVSKYAINLPSRKKLEDFIRKEVKRL